MTLVLGALCLCGCTTPPDVIQLGPALSLLLIAEGFTSPVGMAVPGDGSGRIFIADQVGRIHIITAEGLLLEEPFLDIADRLVALRQSYDERGLLGLAFHPEFADNGRFFVFYNAPLVTGASEGDSLVRVSEFHVSDNGSNTADPDSEVVLLEVVKPQFNHNGGQLAFGPDGYCYIGIGDGGGANDTGTGHTPGLGNAQDTSSLLGTILRYNTDTAGELLVPQDNPFTDNPNVLDPIYAYGLRNPWRFAFDRGGSHRLFCGDVGQNLYEEIDIVTAGANLGWNIKEGTQCFDPDNPGSPLPECSDTGLLGEKLTDPILEYPHEAVADAPSGLSVIGGRVYRGSELTGFFGTYIFGDWSRSAGSPDGSLFTAEETDNGSWTLTEAAIAGEINGRLNRYLLGFGEDENGELYVLTSANSAPRGNTGQVFRLVRPLTTTSTIPDNATSDTSTTTTTATDNQTATSTTTTSVPEPKTILVEIENFRFDADGNNTTQVDTITINAGDTVVWIWIEGNHTVTSGEGALDLAAGDLFDESINSINRDFSFTFTEPGTVPYFCRPHESQNMRGIIIVE